MSKTKLQLVIYLSALLLTAGVFLPLTSFPVYGEVSYYRIARYESWGVIFLALSSPALILTGKEKWHFLSPLGIWLVLLFPAIRSYIESKNQTVLGQIGNELSNAMVEFTSDFFLNIADFHWGGIVFVIALFIFTCCSLVYAFKQ